MSDMYKYFIRVRSIFTYPLLKLLPSCEQVTRWQSESMERPLDLKRRIALRLHLLTCVFCTRYGRQILFTRHALRKYFREGIPHEHLHLSDQAKARMKDQLSRQ